MHLIFGCASLALIAAVWWTHWRLKRRTGGRFRRRGACWSFWPWCGGDDWASGRISQRGESPVAPYLQIFLELL